MWQVQAKELGKNKALQKELSTKVANMMEWGRDVFEPSFIYKAFCVRYSRDTIYLYPYEKCYHYCKNNPSAYEFIKPGETDGVSVVERLMEGNNIAHPYTPPERGNRDLLAFQIVTLGEKPVQKAHELKEKGAYQDYFYWHGFCAAMTEALAARVHSMVRLFLGVEHAHEQSIEKDFQQDFIGKRMSFGYEALPNIMEQNKILSLLKAKEIGITTTESGMLEPEYSTCAMILTKNI